MEDTFSLNHQEPPKITQLLSCTKININEEKPLKIFFCYSFFVSVLNLSKGEQIAPDR